MLFDTPVFVSPSSFDRSSLYGGVRIAPDVEAENRLQQTQQNALRQADLMHYLPKPDPRAMDAVLGQWQNLFPKMGVCMLLAEAHRDALPALQAVCRHRRVPVVGGIFPQLVREGFLHSGGVWLLCFKQMPYAALHAPLPRDEAGIERAIDRIANGIRAQMGAGWQEGGDSTLFLFFDAALPHIGQVLDQLYLQLANRVHYAGVNAGSESFRPMPCLFDGERVVEQGVLVLLLNPHRGVVLEHGYRMPRDTVYATSGRGNCIAQIDWRPAFDVYREWVLAHYGVTISRENFRDLAPRYPLGILRGQNQVLVCVPLALGSEGELQCAGEIPPDSVLTLLEPPSIGGGEMLHQLMDGLLQLADGAVHDLLLFYCAGRRIQLGFEAAQRELRTLAGRFDGRHMAGAVSLGEIGSCPGGGYPQFHGATLAALCWQRST
ncbi:MAG: FIST N-terminal domain-containing protein [Halothiobacillaceae bacterium]|mgnify:FL=1|nr:FIST N-terminal domain-containing protein [Halothiobacillaceae bacterium]